MTRNNGNMVRIRMLLGTEKGNISKMLRKADNQKCDNHIDRRMKRIDEETERILRRKFKIINETIERFRMI